MVKQISTPTDRVARDPSLCEKARSEDNNIDEDNVIDLILKVRKRFEVNLW